MIYLGTIVKNYEQHFSLFETFIGQMIEKIPKLCICIYEDNSSDQTPSLLTSLKNKYSESIHLVSEKNDWSNSYIRRWDGKPCRIECISNARNKLMEMLESCGMGKDESDVCIMMDTDFKKNVPDVSKIVHWAIHFPEDVDALFANGKDLFGTYYDIFAYRDINFPFDYDLYGYGGTNKQLEFMKTQICKQTITNRKERTAVLSAFAGIGIYRGTSIVGIRYSAIPNRTIEWFYQSFMESHPDHYLVKLVKQQQTRQFAETPETQYHGALLGTKWFMDSPFFYYNCWDYNAPVICEHVTFHFEMIRKGHNRLFIEPTLPYEWTP